MDIKVKDYPFTVLAQTKVGKTSGKSYIAVSLGQTVVKDRNASDPKEKYATNWLNLFPDDLLKLSEICRNAYSQIKADDKPQASKPLSKTAQAKQDANAPFDDDPLPF